MAAGVPAGSRQHPAPAMSLPTPSPATSRTRSPRRLRSTVSPPVPSSTNTAPPPWRIEAPMLLIPCPWCGERDEVEFRYGGEAHISRADPDNVDDAAWADYLFMRNNPKGTFAERW